MPHRTGIAEEFQGKDQLLTELTALYNEKGLAQEHTAQPIATDRQKAVVLRDDACRTSSGKSPPPGKKPGNAEIRKFHGLHHELYGEKIGGGARD